MAGGRNSQHHRRVIEALEQNEGVLLRYAARMLGDPDEARDVVQHTFLRLCDQLDTQFPEDPKPWLFKVCRNRILDLVRQAGRVPNALQVDEALQSSSAPDPAAVAERQDLGAWLHTLVDRLPPSQREVIVLWCQGFRYSEIARITDQTEGGVRVKVHRGFVRLREHSAVRALLDLDSARRLDCPNSAAGPAWPEKDRVS